MKHGDIKVGMKLKLREDIKDGVAYVGVVFTNNMRMDSYVVANMHKILGIRCFNVKGKHTSVIYTAEMFECEIKEGKGMEKVVVNEEVAELLRKIEKDCTHILVAKNYARAVYYFLQAAESSKVGLLTQQWLDRNNVTVADIENAFRHGWEVEYEFQEGDLVYSKSSRKIFHVGEKSPLKEISAVESDFVNKNRHICVLVCKKEDRQDLKR